MGPLAHAAAAVGADIHVESLDIPRHEVADVIQQADVEAVAPVMPMRLIQPRDVTEVPPGALEAGTVAWGIKAVRAETSELTGAGAVVAVLDTGIDPAHSAFQGMELVRRNFTNASDDDEDGHGTHCAGTIFGRDVGGVRIGVARGVRRALIGKVLAPGGGSTEEVANAIEWAVQSGAHVISMSLGMDFPAYAAALRASGMPEEAAVSKALDAYRLNVRLFERLAALIEARARPCLIVAAAGNESGRDDDVPYEIGVAPPAVADGVMSVAAVAQAGTRWRIAGFSNTGANVSAPGVDIISARRGGGLASASGTSMATPHVAGVAALWVERIRQDGPFNLLQLTSKIVGRAETERFADGVDPLDRGAGMVIAPQ